LAKLTYYFDPLCPWAWLTSLWVREVREYRPLDVEWKFFSLAEVNEQGPERMRTLRIAAQARREGGNGAVDRAYLALGRMLHERRHRPETDEEMIEAAREPLLEVGLDPDLARRALEDDSTQEDVLRDHREAAEKFDAFGVPWLVLEHGSKGFFGPVIGERVRGEEAAELWDHFVWMSGRQYLFELKRGRANLPSLPGLSAEFVPSHVGSQT